MNRRGLGFLLTVPAFVMLLATYVAPTVWTIWTSLHRGITFGDDAEFAGLENYTQLSETEFSHGVGTALLAALLPAVLVVTVAPAVAFAAYRAGTPGRWLTRIVLAVPLAVYSPTAFAAVWLLRHGLVQSSITYALVVFLLFGGLALALAVTGYLAAFRGRDLWAVLTVGGLAVLTVVALSVQQIALPLVLHGQPDGPPALFAYLAGFRLANFGLATAVLVLVGVVLGALGLLAGLLVVLVRPRLEPATQKAPGSAGWLVVSALAGLALLAYGGYLVWLWLAGGPLDGEVPAAGAGVQARTWLPPLLGAVVSVGVAALAGYGIGALRPLGRRSEWLLLPFVPWLFVGSGPLSLAYFRLHQNLGTLDSWFALVPLYGVAIPALVLFTVLFRGSPRIATALPMVFAAIDVTWVLGAQDLYWQLLMSRAELTGPLATLRSASQFGGSVQDALPVAIAVLLLLLAVSVQLGYLDRLALRTGEPPANPPPAPPAPSPAVQSRG